MRVVNRVHNNTTNAWADTLAAVTAGRTNLNVLVLDVTDGAKSGSRFKTEAANLARRQTYLSIVAFLGHKLRFCTSATHHLRTLAWVNFNGVNLRTNRDTGEGHAVGALNRSFFTAG